MKLKVFFSFLLGSALTLSAQQGFKDGIEYFKADQPEEAAIILEKTLNEASTDKALANYYLGLIDMHNGNLNAAKGHFDQGIAANANCPLNYIGLGYIDLKQGNADAAEKNFKVAREFDKKDAAVFTEIARTYYNVDPVLYAKAIEKNLAEAKKVSKKNPEPAIYILEGDMLAKTNVGDAASFYQMANEFDVNTAYPEAYVKYARVYFHVNPQYSIDKLKELLAKRPDSALAQRELAEEYYESDRLTLAAEQYGEYIKNPNHFQKDEIRYVALLYFGKKYQESFDLAGKILGEEPDNIYMQRMQFLNLEKLGQYEKAREFAEKFLNNTKVQGNLAANDYTTYGDILQNLGQDTLAALQYEEAVKIAPEKKDLLKDLSGAYTKAKMYTEAADAQQRFVDAGEATTNDIFMLARRYQNVAATATDPAKKQEVVEKALNCINTVLERVPDNATIVLTKARIQFVQNDNKVNEDVVKTYLSALEILDKDPANKTAKKNDYINAYNQIANYYLGLGDNENARLYFTKFLEIDPENEALRNYLENNLK